MNRLQTVRAYPGASRQAQGQLPFTAVAAALAVQALAGSASAFDAVVSWTRVAPATSYNVYIRYDNEAFVKGTGPNGSNLPSSLVATARGDSAQEAESIDGVFTSLASGAVSYLATDLPLGPTIFFTVTTENVDLAQESRHSNELSIDYAAAARVVDSDGDGLTDAQEDANLNRKRDDGETDRLRADSDSDGLSDGAETRAGLNPLAADSDGDGRNDATDTCHDMDRDGFGAPGIVASTCPADNCVDVSNPSQADGDRDGRGEACDPCTNIGAKQNFTFQPKMVFRKVNADPIPGDDVVTIKGSFHLPSTTGFSATNPSARGARVVVTAHDGETILDVTIPPGTFGTRGARRGWKGTRALDVWKYLDKTNQRVDGIAKIVFKDLRNKSPRLVGVVIRGKGGDYPVLPGDPPINASVVMGDESAARAGQCGETSFRASDCSFVTGGRILACPLQ